MKTLEGNDVILELMVIDCYWRSFVPSFEDEICQDK